MNKALYAVIAIIVLVAGVFIFSKKQTSFPATQNQSTTSPDGFSAPKKAAHYESNTPEHEAVLAGVPVNVVIDFNFDVAKGSEIKIENSGKDYGLETSAIDENGLTLRRKMDPNAPDGLYAVSYKACWADGSCHDGAFQFRVDRSKISDFTDMTGEKEITINLQNLAFSAPQVRVSKGTKVTWVNQDDTEHTVNTNSHPAHTYYLDQNSRTLAKGDTYSTTFNDTGIFLYHCTPHADTMHGQIIVE